MIDRAEAEQIAAGWARQESLRRGYECTPMLSEFDVGYVVWSKEPPEVLPMPGDGTTTIIDKETGHISTWPGLPPMVVQDMYRQRRASVVSARRTASPEVELRRNVRRRPTPGVAAHLTLRDKEYVARGAKGDQELDHHPLVRDHLDGLSPGHLARGGDRHAELLVLSDALHALEAARAEAGEPPLTVDGARDLLRGGRLAALRVREPGDPAGGQPMRPCESCLTALVHFGVLPPADLAFTEEWLPRRTRPNPQPGRFPDDIAAALVEGGWSPRESDEVLADAAIERVCAVAGQRHRHTPFPAARRALADFPGIVCGRRGPGMRHWIRRFQIDPMAAAFSADILADFAAVIGVGLFPLGAEGTDDSMLAIDEHGRVFALDQAGEWFIGHTVDTALVNLLLGAEARRVRDDGTWN